MSASTLNGVTVTSASVRIPAHGLWYADVTLDAEVDMSGSAELKISDLTLRGTIQHGGPSRGSSRYVVVAGAGGWATEVAAQHESNDAGVKLKTVLTKVAAACGERIGNIPARSVGPSWTRARAPAVRVLSELLPQQWYVDEDGVTQVGRRARVDVTTSYTVIKPDAALGRYEIAAESIASLLPGAVIDVVEAVDVWHDLDSKKLRSVVWTAREDGNARSDVWRRIVLASLPDYQFRGRTEWRVVAKTGDRFDLQCVRSSLGMPDMQRVPVRAGLPGLTCTPKLGALVDVMFLDHDPGRPVIVGFDDSMPTSVQIEVLTELILGSEPALAVARDGDTAGPWPVIAKSIRVKAGM